MDINPDKTHSFKTSRALNTWLQKNHASEDEVWVKVYKKSSDIPSVDWEDCVIAALTWGWIDGIRKSLDDTAWMQRLTPRRKKSGWSKRNCEHALRLIKEGSMQSAGLAEVEAARLDGRWDSAYDTTSEFKIPDDFLDKLSSNPSAQSMFETLNRRNLYAIYYRLHTAKKKTTRENRIEKIIAMLANGEKFH